MRGLHSLGSENLKSDGFVLETVTILCGYMPFGFGNPCGSWHETVKVVSVSAPGCKFASGKHCIKKQAFQYSNHACYALKDSTKYLLSLGTGQGRGAEQKINVRGVGARTISKALVLVGHGLKSDLRDIN